jgi:hypothetical protein
MFEFMCFSTSNVPRLSWGTLHHEREGIKGVSLLLFFYSPILVLFEEVVT